MNGKLFSCLITELARYHACHGYRSPRFRLMIRPRWDFLEGKRGRPLFDPPIVRRAIVDSFVKLNPVTLAKNPVMFVVEVGAALTTTLTVKDPRHGAQTVGFDLQIAPWLWFTVLFANFAEAMAEGRGKAQADSLRKTKTDADREEAGRQRQESTSFQRRQLRKGDVVPLRTRAT